MGRRIDEKTLILPALYLIGERPGIGTSELIEVLTEYFRPEGEDAEILAGRGLKEAFQSLGRQGFSYDEVQKIVDRANIRPLCANCHRMIHRDRKRLLTVEELRKVIGGKRPASV